MQAELDKFFPHRQARYTHPSSGFGLIAVGQFNRPAKQLPLRSLQETGMHVLQFAALR
jgi:hypothetical protein